MSLPRPAGLTGTVGAAPPIVLADLRALAQLRAGRLGRRLPQLYLGLVLYGVSHGLMYRGALGLSPWDVLHSGIVRHTSLTMGQAVILAAVVVLVLWIPLREKPGLGTVSNAVLIGVSLDATLSLVGPPTHLVWRMAFTGGGILLCALASAMYIGAQLGRGPRDGLMTGLHRRTGVSLRVVRTCLELSVLTVGFLLGGSVGVGTVLFAFGIGPLTQRFLPHWIVQLPGSPVP
jgi:uncharacterized membrane protein YczE